MQKYWVRETYWTDTKHIEPGNIHHRIAFYKASDVARVLSECEEMVQYVMACERKSASPLYRKAQRLLTELVVKP